MGEPDASAALLESISAELEVALGRPEKVRADCDRLRGLLARPPGATDLELLSTLGGQLRKRMGAIAVPLFELLEEQAARCSDPWPLLEHLLRSRDGELARRALGATERLAREGALAVDRRVVERLAAEVERPGSALGAAEPLSAIARLLRPAGSEPLDPILALYLEPAGAGARVLAARLLDLEAQPVPPAIAGRLLGPEAHAFLAPYLEYTRATHLDLLQLVAATAGPPPALASLRRAEAACGAALLRQVIAKLGWARVNLGIEVRSRVAVSFAGSVPLMLSAAEAALFAAVAGARTGGERWLIVAHGGLPAPAGATAAADVVARFRAYNLAHAEALADILDVSPLTRERVERLVARMDRIVAEFASIFAPHAEECAILPKLYGELRERIGAELQKQGARAVLSAELARLVQSFEDPRSLGEVRTLHGLKRYLHQRGLRLGFRLVETGGGTNRTVDLVLASRRRVLRRVSKIGYVDFEPGGDAVLPHAVALLADAFARHLLYGLETFPSAQVFCYGNEVHYYLAFRNHPAFLRIDFSPPLAGGMIDLEYYGVSVYEQSAHPSPSLEALRAFFERFDFYVEITGTRVHARYDKERALDLGDLDEKAELLAAFVPYLMDVDWTIGSLRLDPAARRQVAEAWAESFAEWGVLPLRQLLTRDRLGVVAGVEPGPTGERLVAWSGEPPYRDRLRVAAPALRDRILALLAELRLAGPQPAWFASRRLPGQLRLERQLLRPLREARARGELVAGAAGLVPAPPTRFERRHEAEVFAEMLAAGDVAPAVGVGRLVAPLERTLRFRATGRVAGHDLERARLPLLGEGVGLFVLRDAGGLVRLAFYARGDVLARRRAATAAPWEPTWSSDPAGLLALLRRNNYLPPGAEPEPPEPRDAAEALAYFRRPCVPDSAQPLPGERVLRGLRAAPGRAVGRALFGTLGRKPAEFGAAVLVAPAVRPEDNTFLYHARGVVSTGGGILSHAGLIAAQFDKPALIVAGEWRHEPDGSSSLLYRTPEYREEQRRAAGLPVTLFCDYREHEHRLREGDLVVLDAVAGTLQVLGQDRDALALDEELWRFGAAGRRLASAADAREVLALRGERARAAHQLRKLLARIADPALARHAAHELLAGEALAGEAASHVERADLLTLLLQNPVIGEAARLHLVGLSRELAARHAARLADARRLIPTAPSLHEVLARRMLVLELARAGAGAALSLRAAGVEAPAPRAGRKDVDRLARERVGEIRAARRRELTHAPAARRRHLLREIERLERVVGRSEDEAARRARARLERDDAAARDALADQRVLGADEAGFALSGLIGWKAANLGEVARLSGGAVPPWFVVTDRAFQEVLDGPAPRPGKEAAPPAGITLREAVADVLARGELDNSRKSALIRDLWDAASLPEALSRELASACHGLVHCPLTGDRPPEGDEPFLAIRSSAREEDRELAARAGEFETFLFVRGEERLRAQLRRAWSGLWTERAIHNRALTGMGAERAGGGVIVQRMVRSRVSGVLQTVNVADAEPREMVMNVGLGLGEGVVSGSVAADHVVVAKQGDLARDPLRFRYVTADKREAVVFDRRAGFGTTRAACLYHQRLRPALEYVELAELVRVAAELEAAYGYPIDVEFAFEGARLFVLQARPVAAFFSLLQETLERHPLAAPAVPVAAGVSAGGPLP